MTLLRRFFNRADEIGFGQASIEAKDFVYNTVLDRTTPDLADTDDLVQLAKTDGNRIWRYQPGGEFSVDPPIYGEAPERVKNNPELGMSTSPLELIGRQQYESSFVCEISDIRLFGSHAIPQLPTGDLLLETVGNPGKMRHFLKNSIRETSHVRIYFDLYKSRVKDDVKYDFEVAAHLIGRHGFHHDYPNYGHWITENLPQLRAVEHYSEVTGTQPMIIINNNPPQWMIEALELMGYSESDWLEWGGNEAYIQKYVIPKWFYTGSSETDYNPLGKKWARRRMVMGATSENMNRNFSKYVFMSREDTDKRSIINLDEVKEQLRPLGFEFYQGDSMDLAEEVQLHSQSEIIMGPYGANLAGILYAEDATLIDIQPYDYFGAYYMALANELDLDYGFINGCEPDEENKHPEKEQVDQDILVDVDELVTLVGEVNAKLQS